MRRKPRSLQQIAALDRSRRCLWRLHGNLIQLGYRGVELPYIYAGNSRGDGRRVAALLITEARQLARAL